MNFEGEEGVLVTVFAAVTKHYNQGNLQNKAFSGELAYSFKGLVHGGECGGRQAGRHGVGAVAESFIS